MTITVNGISEPLPSRRTLDEVIARQGAATAGVAVALNGAVVPRSRHLATVVEAGDVIEIVTAVQGG